MKCDEPFEGNEFEGCTEPLGHSGDHKRYNTRWSRPVPSGELSDDVLALIPERWNSDERDFYLVFEVTNVYLIPVTATSEDAALKQYSDYSDFPDFNREQPIDGSVEVRRPTDYERTMNTGAPIGPMIACPGCGAEAMTRSWSHKPLRKCHGPIEWTETKAPNPRYRWSRKWQRHAGWAVTS